LLWDLTAAPASSFVPSSCHGLGSLLLRWRIAGGRVKQRIPPRPRARWRWRSGTRPHRSTNTRQPRPRWHSPATAARGRIAPASQDHLPTLADPVQQPLPDGEVAAGVPGQEPVQGIVLVALLAALVGQPVAVAAAEVAAPGRQVQLADAAVAGPALP